MTKREMMIKSHQMAKTTVGNYSARLSLALRQLWASIKKGVSSMIKVTGNTYNAKTLLKQVGFNWDANQKAWIGDESAKKELGRISTASYSRANQKLVSGLVFEVM